MSKAAAGSGPHDRGTPYAKMTRDQKTKFVLKVVICALSFGFLFANCMYD
jgi:hypothetical protein